MSEFLNTGKIEIEKQVKYTYNLYILDNNVLFIVVISI